jgi:chromosomal replication initiation ATPase DnaA
MSTETFICPCCSYRGRYSDDLVQTIFETVCEYFQVNAEDISGNKVKGSEEISLAKHFSVSLIAKMTGEQKKNLGKAFKINGSNTNIISECYSYTERKLLRDKRWVDHKNNLEKMVVEKFTAKA